MTRSTFITTVLAVALALAPAAARAWDPSTTHVAMVERAVQNAELHRRMMDASELERGIFSGLQLDPNALRPEQRRPIEIAVRMAHEDSGATLLGGPGSCPSLAAPPKTRTRCIDGDRWEASVLSWIRLGIVLELGSRERLLHHFLDRHDPRAATWVDPDLPAFVLRDKALRNGGSLAAFVNRTDFDGRGPSAVAWLDDTLDPWAPPATLEHLRQAVLSEQSTDREQHLVLALIGIGAMLHVVQDLSVPAHARGDVTAFFLPLSTSPGDRGLPLQEFARIAYGRTELPSALALGPRTDDVERPRRLAEDLRGHVLGSSGWEGLAAFTGGRFLSESNLPPPRAIDPATSPTQAAALLLGAESGLLGSEREGARLAPWPARAGYLVTRTGRSLAAFETDAAGLVHPYLDTAIYRGQAAQLVPVAIDVSASILDLLFPAFPPVVLDVPGRRLELDLREHPDALVLTVLQQDDEGKRSPVQRVAVEGGRQLVIEGLAFAPGTIVLALEGRTRAGHVWISERKHAPASAATARPIAPRPVAPPPATPEPEDETFEDEALEDEALENEADRDDVDHDQADTDTDG